MIRRLPSMGFAAVLLAAMTSGMPAHAGNGADHDALAQRLFGGSAGPKKAYACFVRRYDASHLARHRLQKVSAMKLLVTAEQDTESKMPMYSFRLGVTYRDRRGAFESSGECGRAESADTGHFGCGVDCDGGGIGVELGEDNKSVLVKVDRIRIWRNNQRGDEETSESLVGGADDKVFRLRRANLDDCNKLVTDRKELAALRHK
jgi:hypothetical protein